MKRRKYKKVERYEKYQEKNGGKKSSRKNSGKNKKNRRAAGIEESKELKSTFRNYFYLLLLVSEYIFFLQRF